MATAVTNRSFTVTVTDSSSPVNTASVKPKYTIATTEVTHPNLTLGTERVTATAGTAFTATLGEASGGAPNVAKTYSVSGSPALSLSSSRVLSGTIATAGTYRYT